MTDIERLEVDGAVDIPAPTDYLFSDVVGTTDLQFLPASVLYNNTPVLDQSLDNNPDTTYACTRYSTSRGANEMNYLEGSNVKADEVEEWSIALNDYEAIINAGGSLRGALEQARARKFISGYAICQNKYDMQYALAMEQLLSSGSKLIDWAATRANDGIAVRGRSYWHAFIGLGYDARGIIFGNSYGEDKYSYTTTDGTVVPGAFCVPYDMLDVLFTTYALFDFQDIDKIKAEKIRRDNADIAKMVELGIINGQNMQDNVTREQMAIMLGRLYRGLGS